MIRDIANIDVEMAKKTSLQPWLADGVTEIELGGLSRLQLIAQHDLEFAKRVLDEPFMALPFRQRDETALNGLYELLDFRGRNVFEAVASQPWFEDGLDDLEAVLLHVLTTVNDGLLQALVDTHYVASQSINLPLTGEIDLIVIRHTPFPTDDETFSAMTEGTRVIETFTQTPFVIDDLVVLINEPGIWRRSSGSVVGHRGPGYDARHIIVHNPAATGWLSNQYKGVIYHELGHLYALSGPRWLVEGTAEFFRTYIRNETGIESIDQRLEYLRSYEHSPSELPVGCNKKNLQQHLADWKPNNCDYYLGETFLLGMHKAIGPEGVSAALNDLRTHGLRYGLSPRDDLIYQAFEKHTPIGQEDSFQAAYQRYHGGSIIELLPVVANRRNYLMELYESARGTNWTENVNWLNEGPLGEWYGVITDFSGRVTGLALSQNDLSGEITSGIGNLVNLGQLNLSTNRITGGIPPELGGLVSLKELDLSGNGLSGQIPGELANLTKLESLFLGNNQLSGDIPPELARLTKLERLYLHNNQLSGKIPEEFTNFSNLLGLQLRENRLSGRIPPELGQLTTLRRLELSENQLSGQIPAELGNLTEIERLTLAGNQLIGKIPLELVQLTSLTILDLSENLLEGTIPSELENLSKLRRLELRGNQLSGEIPKQLGNLIDMSLLDISENQLIGSIPKSLGNLSKLWTLDLSDNQLIGEIPTELSHFKFLTSLDLSNNQLTGDIPPDLGSLPNLKKLLLGGNRLTGCIPVDLRNVPTNDFEDLSIPFCDSGHAGNGN